jgi:peptide/nickel transport system permease protein
MPQFVGRRILTSIPVLFGILFITFALARLLPGDPCRAALGERATAKVCDAFIKRNGLDKPIHIQFGIYLQDVFKGDLGNSLRQGRPAMEILIERLPTTVELAIYAMLFAIIVGVPLGIISAYWRTRRWMSPMVIANVGFPPGVLGLMLEYLFAIIFKDTFFGFHLRVVYRLAYPRLR